MEEPTTAFSFDKSPTAEEKQQNTQKSSTLWHGLGLFGESYLLFSIGTLKPIWETLYPSCFDELDDTECAHPYLSYKSITYSVVTGVMIGMVLLGILANTFGRRRGSILTASLMTLGAVCMTISSIAFSSNPSILFPIMSFSLFVFGIGVGGEYPLSASSASERAMVAMKERRDAESDHEIRIQSLLSDNPELWQTLSDEKRALSVSPVEARSMLSDKNILSTDGVGESGIRSHIPLSPTNTTNDTRNSLNSQNVRLRTRGKEVLMVFSMQGAGIFANSLLLTFLLMLSQRKGENYNDGEKQFLSLLNIWRITYAIGTLILAYVLVSRILYLTESEVWAHDRAEREVQHHVKESQPSFESPEIETKNEEIPDVTQTLSGITLGSQFDGLGSTNLDGCKIVPTLVESIKGTNDPKTIKASLLLQHYGVRLFGTSLTWLLWDIAFYGNKLFQSSFLLVLTGKDASLMDITGASAINAFVALLGYYVAAAIVDDPDVGRLTLQQIGFIVTGTLFLLCGCLSDRLSSTWLVVIYFGSSFFGNCGPNCTTFLIPAEIFPTEMRTMCHGISASSGKLGALIASVLFNFISEKQLFLCSGYASFIACCITFITIPETTTLDLYEIDKQWRMILDGRKFDYEGPANDVKHLSFYERNQHACCRR
eukprot:scaffold25473_cov53-Cyclotella_meneghiniana.AAC.3